METIYDILKREHENIKKLFSRLFNNDGDFGENFLQLKENLEIHLKGEELYFYPLLGGFAALKSNILEAFEENKHSKMILDDLKTRDYEDEEFLPKLKVLREMIDHHLTAEEFTLGEAQELLSDDQENAIKKNYLALKISPQEDTEVF